MLNLYVLRLVLSHFLCALYTLDAVAFFFVLGRPLAMLITGLLALAAAGAFVHIWRQLQPKPANSLMRLQHSLGKAQRVIIHHRNPLTPSRS